MDILQSIVQFGSILGATLLNFAVATPPAVTPEVIDAALLPGESVEVLKFVKTPELPPFLDIVFLVDTTGSMGPAIDHVKDTISDTMREILTRQSTAQFAAAEYHDESDAPVFVVNQALTVNVEAVQAAINGWTANGGGDLPEGQLAALFALSNGAIEYRPNGVPVIVWLGDASGHDPSDDRTLPEVTNSLVAAGIRVIAVPVVTEFGDGLDAQGQATVIASTTNGLLLPPTVAEEIDAAIINGLTNLPTTVTPNAQDCAPLIVSFTPAAQTVTNGSTSLFTEAIDVPDDAELRDTTISCSSVFTDTQGNIIGTQKILVDVSRQ